MCRVRGPGAHLALWAGTPSSYRVNILWHFLTTCRDVCPERNHRWEDDCRVTSNNYFFPSLPDDICQHVCLCVSTAFKSLSDTKSKDRTQCWSHTKGFERCHSRSMMSLKTMFVQIVFVRRGQLTNTQLEKTHSKDNHSLNCQDLGPCFVSLFQNSLCANWVRFFFLNLKKKKRKPKFACNYWVDSRKYDITQINLISLKRAPINKLMSHLSFQDLKAHS